MRQCGSPGHETHSVDGYLALDSPVENVDQPVVDDLGWIARHRWERQQESPGVLVGKQEPQSRSWAHRRILLVVKSSHHRTAILEIDLYQCILSHASTPFVGSLIASVEASCLCFGLELVPRSLAPVLRDEPVHVPILRKLHDLLTETGEAAQVDEVMGKNSCSQPLVGKIILLDLSGDTRFQRAFNGVPAEVESS